MYGNNGMHVTAGTVGQLSYLIVGVNPFQKKKLHNMPNYRGKKKKNKNAMHRNRTQLENTPVGDRQILFCYVQ